MLLPDTTIAGVDTKYCQWKVMEYNGIGPCYVHCRYCNISKGTSPAEEKSNSEKSSLLNEISGSFTYI